MSKKFTSLNLDELISLYNDKEIKNQISNEWDEKIVNQLRVVVIYCLTRKGSKKLPREFLRLDHNGIKSVFIPPIVKAMNGVKLLKFIKSWYNFNVTNMLHLNEVLPIICLENINLKQLYSFTEKSLKKLDESGKDGKFDEFQKFLIMLNLEILKRTEEKMKNCK